MMSPSISIDRKLKKVIIEMALETARPSKASGKTMLIASTRGLRTSPELYARRPVLFTANVFFYPANTANSERSGADSARSDDDSSRLITGKRRKSWRGTPSAADREKEQ
jgi:hypothetical protein